MPKDWIDKIIEDIGKDDKAINVSDEEFFMTPKWLMCRPIQEVPFSAKAVYSVIKSYCQMNGYFTWVSNRQIAQDIGTRKSTVEHATKKLLDLGLIGRLRRKNGWRVGNISSIHYLRWHAWMDDFEAVKAKREKERVKLLEREGALMQADMIRREQVPPPWENPYRT